MDNHLDGSHLGDTGHIRWFDSSWKKEERKKIRKDRNQPVVSEAALDHRK